MIKVRIKATGEIREETPNIAFDLIDRGIGELVKYTSPVSPSLKKPNVDLPNTPKTENSSINASIYTNRQMRSQGAGRGSGKTVVKSEGNEDY
jgi:hypothetical protein